MREKLFFLKFCLVLSIVILFLRLFQLQIIEGKKYRQLAEGNRIRKIKIAGPRGIIFDRHGEILAKNLAVFKLEEGESQKIITRDEALKLQAEGKDENLYIDFIRNYPKNELFAHVVGYLGEVGEEEIRNSKFEIRNYQEGDLIGRMGVEEFFEDQLKGKSGGELVEVDTRGKILRKIGKVEPEPGKNVTLAVDVDLQKVAAREMLGEKGAVVASNPKTGEILVLYSSPSFDPNFFVSRKSEEVVEQLISDEKNRPLLNRAISGIYPPGSTFKIVTAAAGLEEKKINKDTLIADTGVIYVGPYKYANWYFTGYGKTEGEINIVRAIKRSTDTFFYKLGEMVGIEKLVFWAKKFGLDKTFGIDLPGEIAGFVPTPEWKIKVKGEPWFLGNTYHLSIGQGDLALTPLGVNMMASVIANEGKICKPRMLKNGPDDRVNSCQEAGVKKENIEIIKEGMIEACSAGGTAWPFFDFKITRNSTENTTEEHGKVACKTGTAEYTEDGKTKTHAWFTAFAVSPTEPAEGETKWDRPSIVVTVLVEGGGEGSSVAAPIAKEILKEWFEKR